MGTKQLFIKFSAALAVAACLTDILFTIYFGNKYPGYNQLVDTLSKLGSNTSPVAHAISTWWIIICILFVIFALGFRTGFGHSEIHIRRAFWFITIYALGEGMGSGIFPANHSENGLTLSLIIHDTLGGIGIAGIMITPFVLWKVEPFNSRKIYRVINRIVIILGPLWLILFSLSKIQSLSSNYVLHFEGLWQRLLTFTYYIYIVFIASLLWKEGTIQENNTKKDLMFE